MVVFASLQLGGYWFMTAMGVWIDQVVNDALSQYSALASQADSRR
jgi:hypothetical protein